VQPLPECRLLKVGHCYAGALQITYKCSPYSVYVKDPSLSPWLCCHCSNVLLSELKLWCFQCSSRYRVCAHCEGTRFRACDVIFICCYRCGHLLLLHFKYAPFSVYKIQHCWLWVSLLSENVSIAFFPCTTPKRDVILESDSWIMNSMKLFWKLPMSNTVSNWMSQWERYGTIFHRSN